MAPTDRWPESYREMVDRNLGLITEDQQERLRGSRVCVFGMGGIGGPAFEVLVRCGIGSFAVVDRDTFEPTNLNRQIHADRSSLGRKKVEAARDRALAINPEVAVVTFDRVGVETIGGILAGADAAVLAIDELEPCLVISRKARDLSIPLVEGWAIPYGNVRVFTPETPTLEEAYGLPTQGRAVSDIDPEEMERLGLSVLEGLGRIDGVADFYGDLAVERILAGQTPSFAPLVWLTSVLMALETVKVLLGWGEIATGPRFTLYDPFRHRVPEHRG